MTPQATLLEDIVNRVDNQHGGASCVACRMGITIKYSIRVNVERDATDELEKAFQAGVKRGQRS